jgi:hypothetical protein
MKSALKEQAIDLRKSGKTYTEITRLIPVSKGTLSFWLRNVQLSPQYLRKIQVLRQKAREKGWEARRNERLHRIAAIQHAAPAEVACFLSNPLWLVGLALYWAEGSKEKKWSKGSLVTFTNMDIDTILLFKRWSIIFLDVSSGDFSYSVYVHDTYATRLDEMRAWWASALKVEPQIIKVYLKRSNVNHVRHNDGNEYRGVFRLQIRKSVDMNRRISAWTTELVKSLKSADSVR